jgi:glycosyltransferase involved in cell wall biosynthesis
MKVLQMGPYPPPHGGVQTNLVAIRRYLLERGVACPVINLTRFRREERDGIYYPKTAWGVLRLLQRLDYDVIHVHVGGNLSRRHTGVMLLCSLMPRKKTLLSFHSGGYPCSEAGKRAKPGSWRGFVLRRLDGLIAVNQELADLLQRFGVAAERIRLIPPYAAESPGKDTRLPEPIESFYRAHDPVLVTVSGLEPEYDLRLQIEALGRLRRQFPRIGLAVIGGGSQEAQVRKWIAAKPYGEHIHLCGDVAHETTLRAIAESALFLRTTLYDGDSISVREALHLGIPVVASDNGPRPAGVNLVPVSDLDALCRAVEARLKEPAAPNPPARGGDENLAAVFRFYTDLTAERRGAETG